MHQGQTAASALWIFLVTEQLGKYCLKTALWDLLQPWPHLPQMLCKQRSTVQSCVFILNMYISSQQHCMVQEKTVMPVVITHGGNSLHMWKMWLQRKLHILWQSASSDVTLWLSCIMCNVGARLWKGTLCGIYESWYLWLCCVDFIWLQLSIMSPTVLEEFSARPVDGFSRLHICSACKHTIMLSFNVEAYLKWAYWTYVTLLHHSERSFLESGLYIYCILWSYTIQVSMKQIVFSPSKGN